MIDQELKHRIERWAKSEPLVIRAYIFGGRAREDFRADSDLDIAVEIQKREGDENLLATWIFESPEMVNRVSTAIPDFSVDLQWLYGNETPIVTSGVSKSSCLIYENEQS